MDYAIQSATQNTGPESAVAGHAQSEHENATRIPEFRQSTGQNFSNIPVELRSYPNFLGWRYETGKRGKLTKVPYIVGNSTSRASSTNPATWSTYTEACRRAGEFNGIGFSVEKTEFCGFDFDHCRNKVTGEILPWFRLCIQKLNSYTEVTPSGEGVRVWVQGKLPSGARNEFQFADGSSVEIYDAGRYFTLTGDHIEGTPSDIRAVDVRAIHAEIATALTKEEEAEDGRIQHLASQTPPVLYSASDPRHEVEQFLRRHSIKILRTKVRGSSIVYEIECQGSHGDYDKADGKAFIKVFSDGGIFYGCLHKTCSHMHSENHWHELRQRHDPETCNNGFNSTTNHEEKATTLVVVRGDQVAEKATKWLWRKYLPLGKLVHFSGNSSQAKSPVSIDLAARMTVAASWPDGTPNDLGPRSVIVLNIEDDVEDTIVPRFRLAGGDKSKLYCVTATRVQSATGPLDRGVALDSDIHALVGLARSITDLGLIVVDPITNYLGTAKMNAEEDVRRILTPLANLAEMLSIGVITIGHFNRREKGTDPLHRIMGAAAFFGVARAVYGFGPDPDSDDRHAHVMTVMRSCGSDPSSLRYKTELIKDAAPDCPENEIVRVVWCGKSNATAEDAVDPQVGDEKSREVQAAELIKEFLAEPPYRKHSKECEKFLAERGFGVHDDKKPALNLTRVRRRAGVRSKKFPGEQFNSWYRELPIESQGSLRLLH